MTSKLTIALAAGTGGIAPSLVHLAQGFIKSNPDVPGFFYFVGVAIFFGLGALVAFFFAETEAKKAFFLGIGLPALIATAQAQGPLKSAFTHLIPSAYAQATVPVPPVASERQPKLSFKPSTDCKECEIWFTNSAGTVISKQMLDSSTNSSAIAIPKGASKFGVADPKSNFKLVPVPEVSNTPVTIEFERKYSPLNDLRRGLGDYNIKSYDADIQIKRN